MTQLHGAEAITKVGELLKHFSVGMLVTQPAEGGIHVRPMTLQTDAVFDGDLWFFTDRNSRKVSELNLGRVSVVLQNHDDQIYLHLSGAAHVQENHQAKVKELWSLADRPWFPEGPDDPNFALLHFVVEDGEYWEAEGGYLVTLVGLASAVVSGTRAEVRDDGTVDLDR